MGTPSNYENSETFLRRDSNPFDSDFEKTIGQAPKLPARTRRSDPNGTGSRPQSVKKLPYDEVTLTSGRPVLVGGSDKALNTLTDVSFESPLKDTRPSEPPPRPIPAPRLSKMKGILAHSTEDEKDKPEVPQEPKIEDDNQALYEELKPRSILSPYCPTNANNRPIVPPRNKSPCDIQPDNNGNDNIYSELDTSSSTPLTEAFNKNLLEYREDQCNNNRDRAKSTTIDIRKDVNKLWEKAVQELQLDESLVEYMETRTPKSSPQKSTKNVYDSVAIPEQRFKIVNGIQVPIPVTLLKNFDPYFDKFDELEEELQDEEEESKADEGGTSDDEISWSDNDQFRFSLNSNFDLPPPNIPPPPVPHPYENIWIPPDTGVPEFQDQTDAKVPSHDMPKNPDRKTAAIENEYSIEGASALPSSTSSQRSSLNRQNSGKLSISSDSKNLEDKTFPEEVSGTKHSKHLPPQRSASTSNLSFISKKFSFNKLGKKFSEQVMKPASSSTRYPPTVTEERSSLRFTRRSSALEGTFPGTLNNTGPLYVFKTYKKSIIKEKWCVLGNANLRYFDHQDSMAEPKKLILLKDILSVSKHTEAEAFSYSNEGNKMLYCFSISFVCKSDKSSKPKVQVFSFGSLNLCIRDAWVEKLAGSLSSQLASFNMEKSAKFGWSFLKVMFAGEWNMSWVCIEGTDLLYSLKDHEIERVNLKKTKNITLVHEIGNLNAPEARSVLVVDLIDRSLYLQTGHEQESLRWKASFEAIAFNNGSVLIEQQLSKDDIPVVVEQCVNFVFRHGCMTEGIYRHSGVKTKIDRLLKEFKKNVWAVAMTREDFSEHDVANALKRFMRTLDEPLLTRRLRSSWMAASKITEQAEKLERYEELLMGLPGINYRSLRRLIGHLRTVANQCDRNLMPNYNLAAIWGPTLLTVDGEKVADFAQTTGESDVCRDLIDNYMALFKVTQQELDREEEIIKKTESFNKNPNPVKLSGEVMMFVYIDTKTGGDCVSIAVTPKMTANDLLKKALRKSNFKGDSSRFILHEVILNGELERPVHYNELIYEVTLKWWQWNEEDRRDTYLLLKRNSFWEEALPCALPPLSVFGEALYSDNTKSGKGQFKKFMFSMSNAKLTRSKEQKNGVAMEVDSYDIEKLIWYIGCESRRHSPTNLNITFIEKDCPPERTKERPYFGRTISFSSHELFVKWIAAMMVAEHQNDLQPPATLLNIEED